MPKMLGIYVVAFVLAVSGRVSATALADCTPIRFEAGRFSASIHGTAPAESVVCYSLAASRGQHVALKVVSGRNTIFSVEGLVDARNVYEFQTEQKSCRILVGQLMRSITPEAFTISVAAR